MSYCLLLDDDTASVDGEFVNDCHSFTIVSAWKVAKVSEWMLASGVSRRNFAMVGPFHICFHFQFFCRFPSFSSSQKCRNDKDVYDVLQKYWIPLGHKMYQKIGIEFVNHQSSIIDHRHIITTMVDTR
jgi:hypothetical protein